MKWRATSSIIFFLSTVLSLSLILFFYYLGYREDIPTVFKSFKSEYEPQIEYKLNNRTEFSGKVEVYRLIQRQIDRARFVELLKMFSLNLVEGSNSFSENSGYHYDEGSKSFTVDESGRIKYSLGKKMEPAIPRPRGAPPDVETKMIALQFLQERGLLPTDFFVASVDETSMTAYSDGVWFVNTKEVVFHRKIEGKEVFGTTGIRVSIGENGIILGVNILYHDIKPYRKVALKSVEEAVADLKCGKGIARYGKNREAFSPKSFWPVKCLINDIELGYFEKEDIRRAPYLYPVYRMMGNVINAQGKEETYLAYIDATKGMWRIKPW